jgi:hypothetical protein
LDSWAGASALTALATSVGIAVAAGAELGGLPMAAAVAVALALVVTVLSGGGAPTMSLTNGTVGDALVTCWDSDRSAAIRREPSSPARAAGSAARSR